MHVVALALVLSLIGAAVSFHPSLQGSPWMWLAFGLGQVPVAALALRKLHADEELRDRLLPRWGDISLGMGSALLLLAGTWVARKSIAPDGSLRHDWLTRAYEQAGDPDLLEKYWAPVLAAVLVFTALEEIGWRGLVMPTLEERLGTRLAWPATGLLYGLAFVPTAWWLRTDAGPNPLVIGAALLGGCVWSFLAARTQRLIPSILSHAVFVWFVVVQFRLMSLP